MALINTAVSKLLARNQYPATITSLAISRSSLGAHAAMAFIITLALKLLATRQCQATIASLAVLPCGLGASVSTALTVA